MSFHPALFTIVILLSSARAWWQMQKPFMAGIIDCQEIPVAQAHLSAI
jgi:hypothetical protein